MPGWFCCLKPLAALEWLYKLRRIKVRRLIGCRLDGLCPEKLLWVALESLDERLVLNQHSPYLLLANLLHLVINFLRTLHCFWLQNVPAYLFFDHRVREAVLDVLQVDDRVQVAY